MFGGNKSFFITWQPRGVEISYPASFVRSNSVLSQRLTLDRKYRDWTINGRKQIAWSDVRWFGLHHIVDSLRICSKLYKTTDTVCHVLTVQVHDGSVRVKSVFKYIWDFFMLLSSIFVVSHNADLLDDILCFLVGSDLRMKWNIPIDELVLIYILVN